MTHQTDSSRELITSLVAVVVTLGAFDTFQQDLELNVGLNCHYFRRDRDQRRHCFRRLSVREDAETKGDCRSHLASTDLGDD